MAARGECPGCVALAAAGVTTDEREVRPPEAAGLEVFAPGEGHGGMVQVRRCRECGALYRYRAHSEYSAGGSWDEEWFWRLPPAAEDAVAEVLAAGDEERPHRLVAALRHADGMARETAALLAWVFAGRGDDLGVGIPAAAEVLADPVFLAGNYAYRALLCVIGRGPDEARFVREAILHSGVADRDRRFVPILLRRLSEAGA